LKPKWSVSISALSICLAVLLVLQTLTFSAATYAESVPVDPGTATFNKAGQPVTEEMYVAPMALLENPQLIPAYTITMRSNSTASENGWINQTGNVEGVIEWQVDIAAKDSFDDSIPLPLEGLKFYDALDPIAMGTYVEGSFKVNGVAATPEGSTANALAYTFPTGFGDKAIVTFKTWIPKAKYYREYNAGDNGWQTVTNTAELRDASDNKLLSSNPWRVAVKLDWIQKYGTLDMRANPSDPHTVTWTIDVNKNYNKQGLKDFTITDALPAGLTFKSAAYQLWDDWSAQKRRLPPAQTMCTLSGI